MKALIWDVDGTLAETERDGHRVAFNAAFLKMGLGWEWSVEGYGPLLKVTGGFERILAFRRDALQEDISRPAILEHTRTLHRLKNRYYAELLSDVGISLRPGVVELLETCMADNFPMAIATTTSRSNLQALMHRHLGSGWSYWFQALVCGEELSRKKPDPQAYALAVNLLGLRPQDCVAVEDSLNGIKSASDAGVPVLLTRSAYMEEELRLTRKEWCNRVLASGVDFGQRHTWQPSPLLSLTNLQVICLEDLMHWHRQSKRKN
jgi:HAD superfamily hydrolase (TIGR01509 family)